jgi:hypothetical protein
MLFENLIKENKEEFLKKVQEVAAFLGIDPNWLMFVMWFETGHTLNSHIQNSIHATGLIQFMPATAKGLGTTVEELKAMSNVRQLDFVQMHLSPFKGKFRDFVDLYCAIFWPASVGKDDSYRITSDMVAVQNPIFDLNKDKDIEKAEIRAALQKQIPTEFKSIFV